MAEIVLINHPSQIWPGARHLHVSETGRLLAITRNPVRDAASRLIEEGLASPSTTMVLRDCMDAEPEVRISIKEALAGKGAVA